MCPFIKTRDSGHKCKQTLSSIREQTGQIQVITRRKVTCLVNRKVASLGQANSLHYFNLLWHVDTNVQIDSPCEVEQGEGGWGNRRRKKWKWKRHRSMSLLTHTHTHTLSLHGSLLAAGESGLGIRDEIKSRISLYSRYSLVLVARGGKCKSRREREREEERERERERERENKSREERIQVQVKVTSTEAEEPVDAADGRKEKWFEQQKTERVNSLSCKPQQGGEARRVCFVQLCWTFVQVSLYSHRHTRTGTRTQLAHN